MPKIEVTLCDKSVSDRTLTFSRDLESEEILAVSKNNSSTVAITIKINELISVFKSLYPDLNIVVS